MASYASATMFIYIIAIIALIALIIYFYGQYIDIRKRETDDKKDLYYSRCPDYWEMNNEGKCTNKFKIGKCAIMDSLDVDFADEVFANKTSGNYAKCKWAKSCNTSWNSIDRLC